MLKSSWVHPYTNCSCRVMKKIANEFHQGLLTIIIVLVIFEGIALKLEKVAQLFLASIHVHPCHP